MPGQLPTSSSDLRLQRIQVLVLVQGPIRMQNPDVSFRIIIADSSDNNGLPSEVQLQQQSLHMHVVEHELLHDQKHPGPLAS